MKGYRRSLRRYLTFLKLKEVDDLLPINPSPRLRVYRRSLYISQDLVSLCKGSLLYRCVIFIAKAFPHAAGALDSACLSVIQVAESSSLLLWLFSHLITTKSWGACPNVASDITLLELDSMWKSMLGKISIILFCIWLCLCSRVCLSKSKSVLNRAFLPLPALMSWFSSMLFSWLISISYIVF